MSGVLQGFPTDPRKAVTAMRSFEREVAVLEMMGPHPSIVRAVGMVLRPGQERLCGVLLEYLAGGSLEACGACSYPTLRHCCAAVSATQHLCLDCYAFSWCLPAPRVRFARVTLQLLPAVGPFRVHSNL